MNLLIINNILPTQFFYYPLNTALFCSLSPSDQFSFQYPTMNHKDRLQPAQGQTLFGEDKLDVHLQAVEETQLIAEYGKFDVEARNHIGQQQNQIHDFQEAIFIQSNSQSISSSNHFHTNSLSKTIVLCLLLVSVIIFVVNIGVSIHKRVQQGEDSRKFELEKDETGRNKLVKTLEAIQKISIKNGQIQKNPTSNDDTQSQPIKTGIETIKIEDEFDDFQNETQIQRRQKDQYVEAQASQSQNIDDYFEDVNFTAYQKIDQSLDPHIEWPEPNQLYHIHVSFQHRLVLGIDQDHDTVLYEYNNWPYQMYYFKRAYSNFYFIVNAESKEFMAEPENYVENTTLLKGRFSNENIKLWKLVPAFESDNNSFYIISEEGQALTTYLRYWAIEKFDSVVLSKFEKSLKQVWYIRKRPTLMNFNNNTYRKYEHVLAESFHNLMGNSHSVNFAIRLQEIKMEMEMRSIPYPDWFRKDIVQPKIDMKDLPEETTGVNQFYVSTQCAKKHKIAYIWYSEKEMPKEYQYLLRKCRGNVKLLTGMDFEQYAREWNEIAGSEYQMVLNEIPIRQRVNMLKLLYLYFESGIYADFDTQINEECFDKVESNEIIFTNRMEDRQVLPEYNNPVVQIVLPEENFMMVREKLNAQVKKMIEQSVLALKDKGNRWKECLYRQCLIVECQRHYRDNTYAKGYD